MILGAGLLVLVGLALFVAGLATGVTALYWGCVAVCVLAAVLLFAARRQTSAARPAREPIVAGAPAEQPGAETPPAETPPAGGPPAIPPAAAAGDDEDPPAEEVEVTDLLLVVDLKDEVLVVDEHPRYHLAGCRYLAGREAIPLPADEARTEGFTPCGACTPDARLAERARARKAAGKDG